MEKVAVDHAPFISSQGQQSKHFSKTTTSKHDIVLSFKNIQRSYHITQYDQSIEELMKNKIKQKVSSNCSEIVQQYEGRKTV